MNRSLQGASWIAEPQRPGASAAPLLRRNFQLDSSVASARLAIAGLGYHEAWINGQRVGDHVLDPAQTDYERRVFYVVHDVTELLRPGTNTLGAMLGNGWFNQDRVWAEGGLSYGQPRLLAALEVELDDGTHTVVDTDADWRCMPGPVVDNNVYAGEVYDARLERDGWSEAEFDDSGWAPVAVVEPPGGRLEPQSLPPMRRIEERCPESIRELAPGRHIVDLGQNLTGWLRMRIQAPAGSEIRLRFAETLGKDGEIDTASTGVFATGVEQVDRYICRGGGPECWEPRFTYHGFRYVEVAGWPGRAGPGDLTGIVVHTDLTEAGHFECSNDRLNRLHRMALWTHRSNAHGIPEDCPARERCGWLGDANMVAEFSMWNFAARSFWEKYLDDIETARNADGLPPNIAPGKRGARPGRPDWTAAFIMLPWYVYLFHGDESVLNRHYEGMRTLLEHYRASADGWVLEGGFGDWFDPGGEACCSHTPPTLTTTFWFHRCAEVMARVAAVLDHKTDAERYAEWPGHIRDAARRRFYDADHGSFGSQTADAMALHFQIVTPEEAPRVLESLVRDIQERSIHLNTGIMGVRYLFEVLSAHDQGDLALDIMHQNSYPSFGHLIERGATTLWECWGEAEHDRREGARSLNHPMMGGFDNWFFNTLAGIRPDPDHPGFRRFFLEPRPIPRLQWVRAHHDSPYGRIASDWEWTPDDALRWRVTVPEGAEATAILPLSREQRRIAPGRHVLDDRP